MGAREDGEAQASQRQPALIKIPAKPICHWGWSRSGCCPECTTEVCVYRGAPAWELHGSARRRAPPAPLPGVQPIESPVPADVGAGADARFCRAYAEPKRFPCSLSSAQLLNSLNCFIMSRNSNSDDGRTPTTPHHSTAQRCLPNFTTILILKS